MYLQARWTKLRGLPEEYMSPGGDIKVSCAFFKSKMKVNEVITHTKTLWRVNTSYWSNMSFKFQRGQTGMRKRRKM